MKQRNYIDLFAGIGGFALGAYWAGKRFDNHFFSEIKEASVQKYKLRFPDAIALGDITKIDYGKIKNENDGDYFISGGFPCQPHSIAGKRLASEDERDLWGECKRALRELRPRYAIFENVPNVFTSGGGLFLNRVISDIHEVGYNVEWGCICPSSFGAPITRNRVWFVAYPQSHRRVQGQLQIRIDSPGTAETREEWANIRSILSRVRSSSLQEKDFDFVCRESDGVSDRVDRLEELGNAIVPQIAEMIWRLID